MTGTVVMPSITSLTAVFIAEAQRTDPDPTWPQQTQAGQAECLVNGTQEFTISGSGAMDTWEPVGDMTAREGQTFTFLQQPVEAQLPDAIVDVLQGFATINVRIRQYFVADTGDKDEASKIIVFGSAESVTIDFVGTPLAGTSPLAVQFTDISTVDHALSVWDFGDGNTATFAGQTHPLNTYTTDACSIALL
jgi:PKD repeat protein